MWRPSQISLHIQLNESLNQSDLAGSHLCINAMKLLEYAQKTDGIPLTKSGALYRKFVVWAAEEFNWPGYEMERLYRVNKVLNEHDFMPLAVMHDLLIMGGLMRHYRKRAVLTKAGRSYLGNFGRLQTFLAETYLVDADINAFERFTIEYPEADMFHFLGVAYNRLSEWTKLLDYAHWCIPIPAIQGWRFSPEHDACYFLYTRVVRPLEWLGLIEEQKSGELTAFEGRYLRKTSLFDRFFKFDLGEKYRVTVH